MKKKISIVMLCLACVLAGCGEKKSTDIKYNVDDFVTLGDYMDVEVTLNEADYKVTQEQVADYAQQMSAYYGIYVEDDTKTEVLENDVIDVDYVGKKDGVAFEGGSATHQIIDVANNMNPTTRSGYIEGFTDGLAGAKVGDVVDCNVTFPENYQSEDLAGQEVTFTFTIHSIQKAAELEDLDDDLVKNHFGIETKNDFVKRVMATLESQAESARQSAIRVEVINEVTEKCEVNGLPKGLLEARVKEYMAGYEKTYCSDGTSLEDFVKNTYGSTVEEFEEEISSTMEENLKQELIFEAIAKKEKVSFDEEGYNTYIKNLVENGKYTDEDNLYETYGPDKESGKAYMKKVYLQQKACQIIVENTKVNYGEKENS